MNQRESAALKAEGESHASTSAEAVKDMLGILEEFETAVDEKQTEIERLQGLLDDAGVDR